MGLAIKKKTNSNPKQVKKILVSQPKPETEKSPYFDLAKKYGLQIDFRPFIHVEGIEAKKFRKSRINILDHTAIIFTSRNAIDHFFRVCTDLRIEILATMKYFCISEAVALYLQKYIQYRKRKVFFGKQTTSELLEVINKHPEEKYLFPCSDIHKKDIPDFLKDNNFTFSIAVIYRTVASDLSDLEKVDYDMIAFFSPSGVKSLFKNFPDFKQNDTRIAAFGPTSHKAVLDAGLILDVQAPMPNAPSMTMAIEQYIKRVNK
ncbi:MAG: uroporphyrinogen-III synthase [Bacteroidia bacterium]|nr:uroporphyrinogen-III synthase [Bacteroidia bacterium]